MDKKLLEAIERLFRERHKGYPTGDVFHKLVTTSGVPERLTPESHIVAQIKITALRTNTGLIEYGFDGDPTLIGRGEDLAAKEFAVIPIDDTNKIWIDSTVNGEGVSVVVVV